MKNATNTAANPLQAIAKLPITTTNNQRRQWSAARGLKSTMEIGKSYPNYDSCHYWPRFEEGGVKYFLCSRNRDAAGELHSFSVSSDTLEGALVMLNEKLRKFFIKGQIEVSSNHGLNGFEQLITDVFLSELHTDLITESAA